jgi:cobalt/nickel transport system permease protein
VHSLPSHLKILTVLLFIFVVVSTPITVWPAFIAFFALVLASTIAAKVSIFTLFKRALIEIPFIFFAILMPFFGKGERFQLGPFNLYREGLLAGGSIVAKGTLGVMIAVSSFNNNYGPRNPERARAPQVAITNGANCIFHVAICKCH